MPLEQCYCTSCDRERADHLPIREPGRDEPVRTIVTPGGLYGDTFGSVQQSPDVSYQCHETCEYCSDRIDRCQCPRCPGCQRPGHIHYCRFGRCQGFSCNGSCLCGLNRLMGYGSLPPFVRYRKVDDAGRMRTRKFPCGGATRRETPSHGYPLAPDSAPYLGLEMEIEVRSDMSIDSITRIWGTSGHGWSTSDGSIRYGAECKTHPSTYAYLARSDFAETIRKLVAAGGRSWSYGTTGLHTHVSRRAFAHKRHEWVFTWLQVSAFRKECEQLAGRKGAHYASWPTPEPDDPQPQTVDDLTPRERREFDRLRLSRERYTEDFLLNHFRSLRRMSTVRYVESPLPIIAGKRSKQDRSVAINVNDDTIELRYWNGTLCAASILGQCAFIDALIRYSGTLQVTPANRSRVSWQGFGKWCIANLDKGQVRHIAKLCANRHVPFALTVSPTVAIAASSSGAPVVGPDGEDEPGGCIDVDHADYGDDDEYPEDPEEYYPEDDEYDYDDSERGM